MPPGTLTVTDDCDPHPKVVYAPDPPSLGTTLMTCTATDASGNHSSCAFSVIVVNPPDMDPTSAVVHFHGARSEAEVRGRLGIDCGQLPADLRGAATTVAAHAKMMIAGKTVADQDLTLEVKSSDDPVWEFEAPEGAAGIEHFTVRWTSSPRLDTGDASAPRIRSRFIGFDTTRIVIDTAGSPRPFSVSFNGGPPFTLNADGSVTGGEIDEDGKWYVKLPFRLVPTMTIILSGGVNASILVEQDVNYFDALGEFSVAAPFDAIAAGLDATSLPQQLTLELRVGNGGATSSGTATISSWEVHDDHWSFKKDFENDDHGDRDHGDRDHGH